MLCFSFSASGWSSHIPFLNSACSASDQLPASTLNIWDSDPYACCLSKATHRHKQLLSRLWSSKVTWSNTPGSMPHSPRIPDVLCPQFPLSSSTLTSAKLQLHIGIPAETVSISFLCWIVSVLFLEVLPIVQVMVEHWTGLYHRLKMFKRPFAWGWHRWKAFEVIPMFLF